jgi:hypothetical protein
MAHSGFKTSPDAINFIFAGNATFTISSEKTGAHFTYKVTQKTGKDGDVTPFFVSVLNGPDNFTNYLYIGFVPAWNSGQFPETSIRLVAGHKGHPEAPSFKAFAWVVNQIFNGPIPSDLKIQHEDKCCVCSRPLTHPESVELGIGPDCAKIHSPVCIDQEAA